MNSPFVPGQRWLSTAEPELGLGTVMRLIGRSVQIVFTGSGVVRQYALESAPLVRAEFRVGERLRTEGVEYTVEAINIVDGLYVYAVGDREINEGLLDAEQPVSQADARLLSGRVDRSPAFELRREALRRRAEARRHPGWGVLGARIDLIPHQLKVAELAAERRQPRLLLADEVGLGKTIEAGMITAQQLATGRAQRVLVLVPESLVHQWFVELLRRFNLRFALYDEERCEAITEVDPSRNPFEDEQCVIAAVGWLANDRKRCKQLLEAGWDLLVVDEAHHLAWAPEQPSPEYALVEQLSTRVPGLILLTATPEQLGRSGHFARLRLLDAARYSDLDAFIAESDRHLALSRVTEALLESRAPDAEGTALLQALFADEPATLAAALPKIEAGDEAAAWKLVEALIDRHGTGRVMIRNRRAAVGGFPERIPHVERLHDPSDDPALPGRLRAEALADIGAPGHHEPEHDYTRDPRFEWLLQRLEALAPAKVLLLCRSRAKVQALDEALRVRSGLPVARFHEDMNLLQRDRAAAYFADPEGARLLIASEVGAEGRNFQFAQHLVLWDLPIDPDMLEQRIGRLDRIGQKGAVQIHAVAINGSPQDLLLRWYDEGLDAFRSVCADGRELLRRFGPRLLALTENPSDIDVDALMDDTRTQHAELSDRVHRGRDRLLELSSQRAAGNGRLQQALGLDDIAATIEDYPLRLLEHFGIHNEPQGNEIVLLDPEYVTLDAFDELKGGPRQATFSRARALARDDLLYLRADHPLLLNAEELLLSSETGNAVALVDDSLPQRSLLLEALYVLECVADPSLHVDRFLPPLPLTVVVDTRLQLKPDYIPGARALRASGDRPVDLSRQRKLLTTLIPSMLGATEKDAKAQAAARIETALGQAEDLLGGEIERLKRLARINPAVRPEEVEALEREHVALLAVMPQARPRLDALRLILSPDVVTMRAS
ncbi:RNA polymerase-associated protein RapA [Aquimonas sp.]|jgi:ATP-dependent helicase HepA|uniref:RNA polymerase-associated protein RapA n=1 Tax=Aquimonas sp. TaxID=1872588 RepID=UPI0037C16C00